MSDGEDDGRFFEDYTVFGEFEELAKDLGKINTEDTVISFRNTNFIFRSVSPARLPILDCLDYFSFKQEIPRLFNISCDKYIHLSIEDSKNSLTETTARYLLSALHFVFPEKACFVSFGDGECIGAFHDALYSYIIINEDLDDYSAKKCSCMITLTVKVPSSKDITNVGCRATKNTISFPVVPLQPPIGAYRLRAIFPQVDASCIALGIDALNAPIMLISALQKNPLVSKSELVLERLFSILELSSGKLIAGANDDCHEKIKLRMCAPPGTSTMYDRYMQYVLFGGPDESRMDKRLLRVILSICFDNVQSMRKMLPFIGGLWMEFVKLLRRLWKDPGADELEGISAEPDWEEPLIFQKMSLFNYCLSKKALLNGLADEVGRLSLEEVVVDDGLERRGCKGLLEGVEMSEFPERPVYIPFTQSHSESVVMTSDHFAHYQSALQSCPAEERSRLHALPLLSDMQSFKAANPGSSLVDFCQWYSPKDIIIGDTISVSERMKEGLWAELWEEAKALAACEQPPLFNIQKEAEKALFYFEDLSVRELFQQLIDYSSNVFDFDSEHSKIKNALLANYDSETGEEDLVASEEHRDRVQEFFRENSSLISLQEQSFVLGQMQIIKRGRKTFLARMYK